jgi:hypothetical protein
VIARGSRLPISPVSEVINALVVKAKTEGAPLTWRRAKAARDYILGKPVLALVAELDVVRALGEPVDSLVRRDRDRSAAGPKGARSCAQAHRGSASRACRADRCMYRMCLLV